MNLKMHLSARAVKTAAQFKQLLPALAVGAFLTCTASSHAINASPRPVDLVQPDGTRITLRPQGDEFTHWFEDMDGFAVVRNGAQYVYAQRLANGALGPTASLVGRDNPRALNVPARLRPSPQFILGQREAFAAASPSTSISRVNPVGTVKNLVILCRFSDHTEGVHTRPAADYDVLMNSTNRDPVLAPTGSLRDYYRETSYGTMTLQSTVIAWITLPQTEEYYAAGFDGSGFYPRNAQRMVEDALNAVDPLVNFADFDTDNDGFIDAIDIIHSGYGAETGGGNGNWIWSHRWNLAQIPGGRWTSGDRNANNVAVKVFDYHTEPALWDVQGTDIVRVGVLAHETGHFFGLPDLYDTDGFGEGAGSYCLMANSWGFDFSQLYPPHFGAWARIQLGWVTPTNIQPGLYNAPRVESTRSIFKITNGFPSGEYLLIENRQPVGFEAGMPQGGLAIWHIDEAKLDNDDEGYPGSLGWPNSHYKVALLQADGAYHLERGINRGDAGDVYRGGGVSAITPSTVPNTHRYQYGLLATTANIITNISSSASNMTFTYINTNAITVSLPQIVAVDATLSSEGYSPTNRSMDPGEVVGVTFRLRNIGTLNADVTATLQANANVLSPSAAQMYSLNTNRVAVGKTFSFTAGGTCGTPLTTTLQLSSGGTNIGTTSFNFSLGARLIRLNQNFDAAVVPALPANWETGGLGLPWITVGGILGTPTNAAFVANPSTSSDVSLTSPLFVYTTTNAQLSFSHRYNTEYGFDGGVLEISINNGAFMDIIAAGGNFVANGYNFFIDSSFGNTLAGRDAWTGMSSNFVTTVVSLPAAGVGKAIRLRWRFASDDTVGSAGWYVDAVQVGERACSNPPTMPLLVNTRSQGTNVVFSFTGRNGVYYAVEYKESLLDPTWIPLTVQPANGLMQSITNNLSAGQRFYRLRGL